MKLRFRNRIALFSALAAAVTIGLVFLAVYGVVYITAYRHLDNDLRQENEEVVNSLRWVGDSLIVQHLPEWEEKEHEQVEANPSFLQIIDTKGHLLFRSTNLLQEKLLINPEIKETIFFNSTINGQRSRHGQFPIFNDAGKILGHVTVGISQEESANVLHNLRVTLWLAFPLLLLVLFLATSVAAARGILPVHRLIKTAAEISESNFHVRLPLPEHRDEIFQLASTINDLLDRLEKNVVREKQFTADASHELRTPLSAIRGNLEVLIRREREPDFYEEKIEMVIREVDRMHNMLDQLLQLARLESGNILVKTTSAPLLETIRGMSEKWQGKLEATNMQLVLDIPQEAIVSIDPGLLDPILNNLVTNAVKYGKKGGQIIFRFDASEHTLQIADDGPGIPNAHIPYLFDRFYRADSSRNSGIPGAGLGLSIVKKLADLQHIQLSVSSAEGLGTTFSLRFP